VSKKEEGRRFYVEVFYHVKKVVIPPQPVLVEGMEALGGYLPPISPTPMSGNIELIATLHLTHYLSAR
jgi:hypothetical protein